MRNIAAWSTNGVAHAVSIAVSRGYSICTRQAGRDRRRKVRVLVIFQPRGSRRGIRGCLPCVGVFDVRLTLAAAGYLLTIDTPW